MPELHRVHGLHVIMAVEQHMGGFGGGRLGGVMGHHHGPARGLARARLKAQGGQFHHQPAGGLFTGVLIGDIG